MQNYKLEKLSLIDMDYTVYFQKLRELAQLFHDSATNFELNNVYEVIDLELEEGIEVNFSEVDVRHELLSHKGRQVLLYIKDHSYRNNFNDAINTPGRGNRFHVANCSTLVGMKERGRFERYVVTNNVSGEFVISDGRQEGKAKLRVCQNCLKMLNYKGSKSHGSAYENAVNFNLTEFFATYSSFFVAMPKGNEKSNIGYSATWQEISKEYREKKNYTCEKCRVYLGTSPMLCHVHHINGVKSDNNENNLQVLCADCHRKEHIDHMYVSRSHMNAIAKLRYQQNIGKNVTWEVALKLVDPVLLGDLEMAREKGYEPPYIHFMVKNTMTGEEYYLDAAWPNSGFALNLEDLSNVDLKLYGFRSFLVD